MIIPLSHFDAAIENERACQDTVEECKQLVHETISACKTEIDMFVLRPRYVLSNVASA